MSYIEIEIEIGIEIEGPRAFFVDFDYPNPT